MSRLLREAEARLTGCTDSPRLDAELLLAHAMGAGRAHLYAWPDRAPPAGAAARFDALVEERRRGAPIAYLLGRREFWSLDLRVRPGVLVPRPDTEALVQAVLDRLPGSAELRVAELGTGCGAVALALGAERPRWRILATDSQPEACALAAENADRLGIGNVRVCGGDWCAALGGERFHAVVSNPPYVRAGDPQLVAGDLRHEPRVALAAGDDGLEAIRVIAAAAPANLLPGGWLLLEHGAGQARCVHGLLRDMGYTAVAGLRDLAGRDRVAAGRRPAG